MAKVLRQYICTGSTAVKATVGLRETQGWRVGDGAENS